MSRLSPITLWILFLSCFALGTSFLAAAATASEESEFRRLEKEMFDAVVRRDLDAVARIWADDFLSTNSDATVVDKGQWLEAIRSGQWPAVDEIKASDFKLRRFGDTAIITGRSDYFTKGQLLGAVRHTQVWLKRKGRWQMVSWQGTPIPATGQR